MQAYYKLLELSETASVEEIKKAYRRKAKIFHPDNNTSPGAEAQFIALSEAYHYLIAVKTRGMPSRVFARKNSQEDLEKQRKAFARKKAQEAAKKRYEEDLEKYKADWMFRLKVGVITLFNLFIFLRVGFQTMIPTLLLFSVYVFFSLAVFLFLKLSGKGGSKAFIAFCLSPAFLNLLLLINFLISFDPQQENYRFGSNYQTVYDKYYSASQQRSTLITLEGNAYDSYPGIRMFADYESLYLKTSIEYTFETGLFGIRVMSDYQLK